MKISILIQDFDLELLKFINNTQKKNVSIINILVAVKKKMHPIRNKQIRIRHSTYIKSYKKRRFEKLKKLILKVLFHILKLKFKYKIIYLDQNFKAKRKEVFDYTTILYSYEGIISEKNLNRFKSGLINIHPAILPEYRGLDAGLWALKKNDKLGVTAYLLNKGIDTGPIIKRYFLNKKKFRSLIHYKKELRDIKINSFIDAVKKFKKNQFEIHNPKILKSQNRGIMSKNTLTQLVSKIYQHSLQ